MKQKGFAYILLILVGLAIVAVVVVFLFPHNTKVLVETPTSSPVNTQGPYSTAGWKTYTDSKYGFSFKYPVGTEFSQVGSSPNEQYKVVFMGKKQIDSGGTQTSLFDGYIFYVSVRGDTTSNPIDKIATETLTNSKQNCSEQTQYSDIVNIKIGNQSAKTYSVKNCMGDYTENFVSNGKTTFELTQTYIGDKPEYDGYLNITKQILSTFKFTSSEPSAKVTCRSETLGYSISLPDNTWSCTNNTYTLEASSDRLGVVITTLGRGVYCTLPDTNPSSPRYVANPDPEECVVTNYYTNNIVNVDLYKSHQEDKEIFGAITGGPSISIKLKRPAEKIFTASDRSTINAILGSIQKFTK